MAITVAKIGQVDPSPASLAGAGQPLDLQAWEVDITLGATGDYGATGIDLTNVLLIGAAGLNVSQVVQVAQADVRTSGNVIRPLVARFDQASKTLRLYRDSGVLFTNAVQRQNQTTVETTPTAGNAFTLPANTLAANGMVLRYRAWGTRAAVANAVVVKLKIGATIAQPPVGGATVGTLTGTANAVATNWQISMEMIRTGAATQQTYVTGEMRIPDSVTTTNVVQTAVFTATTVDLTAAQTILPTIAAAAGNTADGTIEGQVAEVFGPGTSGAQALEIVPATDLAAGDIVRCLLICV